MYLSMWETFSSTVDRMSATKGRHELWPRSYEWKVSNGPRWVAANDALVYIWIRV
jgi:hypothetical protein